MKDNNYKRAFKELSEIINNMDYALQSKIPENVRENILKNADKNYYFKYDCTCALYEQKFMDETKALLSILYTEYLCSSEEKEKWNEYDRYELKLQEEAIRKSYNTNVFENKEKKDVDDSQKEETALIKYKEPLIQRIINRIKKLFFKK